MTDHPGTAESSSDAAETVVDPAWRADGWEPAGDGGLSDTVVRMPRITDERPAMVPPPVQVPVAPEPAVAPPEWTAIPAGVAAGAVAGATAPAMVPPPPAAPTLPPPPPVQAPAVAASAPRPKSKSGLHRTRKARLRLSRIDPWSVMKTSFLFSIAFGIMFWVATWLLWTVVVQSGLFEAINSAILNIIQNPTNTTSWRIEDYINTNKVLGIAALLAAVNVVISTALGTLFAFLYNLSANVLGGLELTLAED